MNKKGFTLVELLATLVVLGIIFSLAIVGINYSMKNTKKKTEELFISTLRDAIEIYFDDSANFASYKSDDWVMEGTISKENGNSTLYSLSSPITFETIINSEYAPIVEADLRNPSTKILCDKNAKIYVFRDDDLVYYYYINKGDMVDKDNLNNSCLLDVSNNYISNLSEYAIAMIYG